MYYKIDCADFATQEGEFDLLGTLDGVVFVTTKSTLKKPFVKVTTSELPSDIVVAIEAETAMIEAARNAKTNEIDRKRDETIAEGVEFNGKQFQSADHDQALLTQAVTLFSASGGVPEGYTWIAKDNSRVAMTLQELVQLGAVMALRVNENYQKARDLKDIVNKAMTLAEIQAVEWK